MRFVSPARPGRHDGLVLRLLRDRGPSSRTELADITRLSPTTITKTITPLLERGLLEEGGSDGENRVGRPAIAVRLLPEAFTVCGIQLSSGTLSLGLADATARIYHHELHAFDPADSPTTVLAQAAEWVAGMVRDHARSTPLGVGVGIPGAVDRALRTSVLAVSLGWQDVAVADLLEERLRLPTIVDNNARAMALAEANYGQYPASSLAYVYVKKGVGLGLTFGGLPFYSGTHGTSELGHLQVEENGALCPCGAHGCLESLVSEAQLTRQLAEIGGMHPDEPLLVALHRLAASGTAAAVKLENAVVDHLATGFAAVVNLMNPELIVVGGLLAAAPPALLRQLHERTRGKIYPLLRDELRIEVASATLHTGLSGAAALALQHLVYREAGDTRA